MHHSRGPKWTVEGLEPFDGTTSQHPCLVTMEFGRKKKSDRRASKVLCTHKEESKRARIPQRECPDTRVQIDIPDTFTSS